MATYPQYVHDIDSDEIIERTLTDPEIIAGAVQFQVALSADKSSIIGNGVDVCTITVQLVSAPLANDSQVNIAQAAAILLDIDGEIVNLQLDAQGSETQPIVSFNPNDTIVVKASNYTSNEIIIQVT